MANSVKFWWEMKGRARRRSARRTLRALADCRCNLCDEARAAYAKHYDPEYDGPAEPPGGDRGAPCYSCVLAIRVIAGEGHGCPRSFRRYL